MSINSLTETEIRRSVRQLAPPASAGGPTGGASPPPPNNALSMLVKYIPTESVTLYVAAIAAVSALKSVSSRINEETIYWFFGLFTPVLFAIILVGKRRAAGVKPLVSLKDWPWWKHFAATVAFFAWALAVPGPPDIKPDTSGAVVGLLAVFVSTLLSLFEPIFDRPPASNG